MLRRIGWTAGLVLAAAAVPVLAQSPGSGGMRGMAGPSLEELKTVLKLDEAQHAQVGELIQRFQTDIKEPRETITANMQMVREGAVTMDDVREQNRAAMGKIRERLRQLNQEIRAALTPDQQKAFDAWLEQQAQRMQQLRGRRPPSR